MDIFFNLFQGQAYINGFNLGRYWPTKGPQITLYVPAPILKPSPAINTLVLFELEYTVCGDPSITDSCTVQFIDRPILNWTLPATQRTSFRPIYMMDNIWAAILLLCITSCILILLLGGILRIEGSKDKLKVVEVPSGKM